MFVKPIHGQSAGIALSKFFSNIENTLSTLRDRRLHIKYHNKATTLSIGDYRHIVASMPLDPTLKSAARNAVLDACFKAERTVSGAGIASIIIATSKFRELSKMYALGNKDCSVGNNDMSFMRASYSPTLDECFEVIGQYIKDDYCMAMLKEACSLAGASGQIFINNDKPGSSSILLRNGFNFPIGVIPEFRKALKNNVTLYDPRVLLIDGIIESVGEIHHILDRYSRSKEQLVIFARGFSEEVTGTLVVNKLRGMLNVIPVSVPYDLAGINMLNDIAAVCESDVVSSLKGELISSIDYDDISSIEKLLISNDTATLFTSPNKQSIKFHVSSLIKKRNKISSGDVQEMIDQRIQCLSPRAVHINVGPEHGDLRGLIRDRLDTGVRMFKDISRYGIININDIETSNTSILELISYLKKSKISKVPARALHVGATIGDQTANLLAKTSVFLIDDSLHHDSP